ncbi:MAG: DUF4065 domain-containing protein [Bacteroidales bacterium]|nr:DUF4065 domain-containing protein [Bacteroidales bacterium]
MKTCSQAVANKLLDLAAEANKEVSQLKLMKLVYLVHGFSLAINNKSALNPHYDTIEAWKFGPVIPGLYHEFKHFGTAPITKKATFIDDTFEVKEAELTDHDIVRACEYVWRSYGHLSSDQLVDFTHAPGSPWSKVANLGYNQIIPDSDTKAYFKILVNIVEKYAV